MAKLINPDNKATSAIIDPDSPEFKQIQGVELLAHLETLINEFESMKKGVKADIEAEATSRYVKLGMQIQGQPKNMVVEENATKASYQVKKRSASSQLSQAEIATLDQHGISHTTKVVKANTFIVNPDYIKDQNLLATLANKVAEIEDVPDDFIISQEEVSKEVTTPTSLNEVFSKYRDDKTAMELLSIVSTNAVRVTESDSVMATALDTMIERMYPNISLQPVVAVADMLNVGKKAS